MQLPAYVTGYNRRKDRTATIKFATQELSPEELLVIDSLVMEESFGWLCFSPNENQPVELPKEQAEETGKTPSKRLRDVIFVYWKQLGENGDFETFYRYQMAAIVDKYKERLD